MKATKKALLMVLCAALLVAATVMGTIAYLTDEEAVTNTFTVGRVGLSLDELDVDNDKNTADNVTVGTVTRDRANEYHLLPGHTYTKDPTIHVNANSEDSYIYIKVDNGIDDIEAATETAEGGYKTIAQQIAANDWIALEGTTNLFYQVYTKDQADKDLEVFAEFKIDGASVVNVPDGETVPNDKYDLTAYENATITVTAYAVQKDGFADANAAWAATFGAPATNP